MKKKDMWPRLRRKRRPRKVELIIAPLFLPQFQTFLVFRSLTPTHRVFSDLSCQLCCRDAASQAATAALRLQPFAYMTQFLHTNINRAGIFHLTTSSVVQGLQLAPDYSPATDNKTSRTSLFSGLLLSSWTVSTLSHSPYLRTKLWQALSEWEAKKKGPSLNLHAYKSKLPTKTSSQQILLLRKDISLMLLIYPRAENWRHSGERSLIVD